MKNKNIKWHFKIGKHRGCKGTRLFIICIHKPLLKPLTNWLVLAAILPLATFILSYEGIMALAVQDHQITQIMATPVYASRPIKEDEKLCGLDVVECESERVTGDVEAQIRAIAKEQHFQWEDYAVKIAKCESSLNPLAKGDGNYNSRGLYQISKFYWPEVSDECAYSVDCSTRWFMNKVNDGKQGLWSCDNIIKNK